jgi:energy-coupling factor transport system permease protein
MTEVFQYIDGDSFAHRMNPLTKVLFCAFVIIAGVMSSDPLVLLVLLAIPVAALILSGLAGEIIGQLKMLLIIVIFLVIITLFTVRTGTVYSVAGLPLVTADGLIMGAAISLRLVAMFFAFMLLVNTTKPSDLVITLISRLHFPIDYALMLMITLRFIPTLQIEARKIREAQAARGFKTGGIRDLPKSVGPTITPLLSNSIGRAGSLGHIIELRGYHSGSKIKFTDLPLHMMDFACIILMFVGMIAYALYVFRVI